MGTESSTHVAALAHALEVCADFLGALRVADLSGDERGGGSGDNCEYENDALHDDDLGEKSRGQQIPRCARNDNSLSLIMTFSEGYVVSGECGFAGNGGGLGGAREYESGATIGHQCEQCAHDNPNATEPDPFH